MRDQRTRANSAVSAAVNLDKLKDLPELVDEFFGREWVRVFCGEDAAARLGERFDQTVFDDYLRAVKRFSSDTPSGWFN